MLSRAIAIPAACNSVWIRRLEIFVPMMLTNFLAVLSGSVSSNTPIGHGRFSGISCSKAESRSSNVDKVVTFRYWGETSETAATQLLPPQPLVLALHGPPNESRQRSLAFSD